MLVFSACSPIVKWPHRTIRVEAVGPVALVGIQQQDTGPYYLKRKKRMPSCTVIRSNNPLVVILKTPGKDSAAVLIAPIRNYGWLLNMKYLLGPPLPAGLREAKRWTYPRKNYIAEADGRFRRFSLPPVRPGAVYPTITTSVPIFNYKNDNVRFAGVGFLGVELGADYYYRRNSFLSLAVGAGSSNLPFDYFGGYRQMASVTYLSLRNNLFFRNFDIGYGLHVSGLFMRSVTQSDSAITLANTSRTWGIGPGFSAHYYFGPGLRGGFLYQPSLVNPGAALLFNYQHYMAVQLSFRLDRRKHRQLKR